MVNYGNPKFWILKNFLGEKTSTNGFLAIIFFLFFLTFRLIERWGEEWKTTWRRKLGQEETNLFNEVEAFLSEAERLYDEGRIWELRGLAESCESLPIMLPSVAILEQIADRVPGGKYSSLLVVSVICKVLAYAVPKKEEAAGVQYSNHSLRLRVLASKCEDQANRELRDYDQALLENEGSQLVIKKDIKLITDCDHIMSALGHR